MSERGSKVEERIAEQLYDHYRVGKYGAEEYLPDWWEVSDGERRKYRQRAAALLREQDREPDGYMSRDDAKALRGMVAVEAAGPLGVRLWREADWPGAVKVYFGTPPTSTSEGADYEVQCDTCGRTGQFPPGWSIRLEGVMRIGAAKIRWQCPDCAPPEPESED